MEKPTLIGIGITWFEREDYPRILEVMEDKDWLPATYDEWKREFEQSERENTRPGVVLVRVPIDPDNFVSWCRIRGKNVDRSARLEFCSDPANWPNKN